MTTQAHTLDDDAARQQVLEAADRLYYTLGIQAVGMDMLRAESGVSLKRLYRLFPSKETIVEQVLLRRHEMWDALVDDATATDDPRQSLLAIYDMLARWFDQDDFRGCMFINSFGELGATAPRVAQIVRAHKAKFQARLTEIVAEAGAPASLGPQLAILAEGAQTTAAIAGTNDAAGQARQAAEALIDAALRGRERDSGR
ncbi:TetR family transcriptional regulator [Virgisporangium aliadipatigenens]|uniref:TetR family transcriptional regulator n=1 Tax=Virgisporangium aliadipatigenens TaxID=741659 RepID=A0A8J3YIV1_9ACTN|nr:TetR/AcrR family transcriptional regulator [Virgisporangium aliadipatigenens]GIJ46114.1 TetR family transcriptional regulator [Virgisporangium aliadipatigenens]